MSKLRRKLISVLMVLLCAMLALSTAFLIPNKTASAAYSASNFNIIGNGNDLYIGGENPINANLLDELYKAITGVDGATLNTVASRIPNGGGITSADIRTVQYNLGNRVGTNGQNVSIWLGGLKWDVSYITKDNSGNVIVDLWQSADNNLTSSVFAQHSVDDTYADYPSCMYSTSYVRIQELNVGGYYSQTNNSLIDNPIGQNPSHKYARFTMADPSNHDSLIEFIVKPADVSYQANQDARGKYGSGNGLTWRAINDSYNQFSDGWINQGIIGDIVIQDIQYKGEVEDGTAYGSWKNDYLWIPSFAELGNEDGANKNGIWQTDTALRSNNHSIGAWMRSGSNDAPHAKSSIYLLASGEFNDADTNRSLAVRPAFHFNLTKAAEKSSRLLPVPTNVSSIYTGEARNLSHVTTVLPWYDADLYADSPNEDNKPITVTYPDDMIDATPDGLDGYEVVATITDEAKAKYRWENCTNPVTDTSRTFKYKIDKKPLELSIENPGGGTPPTATILTTIAQHDIDKGTQPVIELVYTGGNFPNGTTNFNDLTRGTYTVTARIKIGTGANYVLAESYSTTVSIDATEIQISESDLVWRYQNGTGAIQTFNAGEDGRRAVRYNGNAYTLTISTQLPEHVRRDTSQGTDGYLNNIQTNYSTAAYTTTVYLKTDSEDYSLSTDFITVTWYIDKGLYDLSNVTWDYSAPFTYDPINHTTYHVGLNIPTNLANAGLSSQFASGSIHSSMNAGTFTAKVELSGNSNYETPTKDNPETYIYNGGGDFPWELEWVVEKYTKNFQWNTGSNGLPAQNSSGENFYLPQPVDPDGLVNVKYYKKEDFDTATGKPREGAQPIDPEDMIVATSQEQADREATYFAVLEFKSEFVNNFKFGTGAYMQFNTYDQRQILTVSISSSEYLYDGNPHADFATEVTISGATPSDIANYIVYEYFAIPVGGGLPTSLGTNAPKNAGSYKIKISLNEAGDSIFVINGDSEISYTIKTLVLSAPSIDGELTYNGEERDVANLVGIPEGWENYIEVTITRVGTGIVTGNTIKDVGNYNVTFKIKDGINVGSINSVEWDVLNLNKTDPQSVTIKIKQLVLHAQEWNGNGYYSRVIFTEENAGLFLDYKVFDESGVEVDEGTVYSSVGVMFIVKVSVKDEHGDNVIIVFESGVSDEYEFFTDGGEAPVQVSLPTIPDLVFNGENQTFVIDYGEFADYIEIDSNLSVLTQFDAGEYEIYFKIKSGVNAVWSTTGGRGSVSVTFKMNPLILEDPQIDSNQRFTYNGNEITAILNIDAAILARFLDVVGDISAINAGDYNFTLSIKESFAGNVVWVSAADTKSVDWTIEKAKLSVKWTQNGGVPELDVPEEFKDLADFDYEIKDENGNVVTKEQMEDGKDYTITAKLKGENADNFEFVDDDGATLTNPKSTGGKSFNYSTGLKEKSPFPWWILALIAGVLLLLTLLIIIIVKRRQAAEGEDEYDDFYDDEYDFDEEEIDEEYEDGEDFGEDF